MKRLPFQRSSIRKVPPSGVDTLPPSQLEIIKKLEIIETYQVVYKDPSILTRKIIALLKLQALTIVEI